MIVRKQDLKNQIHFIFNGNNTHCKNVNCLVVNPDTLEIVSVNMGELMSPNPTAQERAKKIAYNIIESICHIVDRNIYSKDIAERIVPDIAAEILEAMESAIFEHIKQHVCFRPEASQVIKRVKAEAYEECAKVAEINIESNHIEDIPREIRSRGEA